jgi:hypothetical protein
VVNIYVTSQGHCGPFVSYLLAVGDFILPHSALLRYRDAPGDTQRGGATALQPHLGGLWAGQRRGEGCKEPQWWGGMGERTRGPRANPIPHTNTRDLQTLSRDSEFPTPVPKASAVTGAGPSEVPMSIHKCIHSKTRVTAESHHTKSWQGPGTALRALNTILYQTPPQSYYYHHLTGETSDTQRD